MVLGVLLGEVTPRAIAQIRAELVRDTDSHILGTRYMERLNASFSAMPLIPFQDLPAPRQLGTSGTNGLTHQAKCL